MPPIRTPTAKIQSTAKSASCEAEPASCCNGSRTRNKVPDTLTTTLVGYFRGSTYYTSEPLTEFSFGHIQYETPLCSLASYSKSTVPGDWGTIGSVRQCSAELAYDIQQYGATLIARCSPAKRPSLGIDSLVRYNKYLATALRARFPRVKFRVPRDAYNFRSAVWSMNINRPTCNGTYLLWDLRRTVLDGLQESGGLYGPTENRLPIVSRDYMPCVKIVAGATDSMPQERALDKDAAASAVQGLTTSAGEDPMPHAAMSLVWPPPRYGLHEQAAYTIPRAGSEVGTASDTYRHQPAATTYGFIAANDDDPQDIVLADNAGRTLPDPILSESPSPVRNVDGPAIPSLLEKADHHWFSSTPPTEQCCLPSQRSTDTPEHCPQEADKASSACTASLESAPSIEEQSVSLSPISIPESRSTVSPVDHGSAFQLYADREAFMGGDEPLLSPCLGPVDIAADL